MTEKSGFTLIEVLVVLVIVSMLVAITAVRWRGGYDRAILERGLQEVRMADEMARECARASNRPIGLRIDLDTDCIAHVDVDSWHVRRRFVFGSGRVRLETLITDGRRRLAGQTVLRVDGKGATSTYALLLETPQGLRRWVVFTGVAGEMITCRDEKQVRRIFRIPRSARPDLD